MMSEAEEETMSLKDWIVPKYLHSNPKVRMKFVENSSDARILKEVSENDSDDSIREAAIARIETIKSS
jgi:hypothetical protein